MGDTKHEAEDRTTVTTVGAKQVVFTYSEPVSGFDAPPTFEGPGVIPVIAFNGSGERLDTPDAAYFSRDDTGGEAWSIVGWINLTGSGERTFWSKWETTGLAREWVVSFLPDQKAEFKLRDESQKTQPNRQSDVSYTENVWNHFAATYDGSGGVFAMDGVTLYRNGVVIASTATNRESYVGTENDTEVVEIGSQDGGPPFFDGKMAGGPLGPIFAQIELTAGQVLELYQGNRALLVE